MLLWEKYAFRCGESQHVAAWTGGLDVHWHDGGRAAPAYSIGIDMNLLHIGQDESPFYVLIALI